ncbi:MAG: alpha/beta fold hydrolase, partial [Gemmatimonadota bacterium]
EYELHLPPGLSPDRPHPLLIFLHGAGDNGPAFRARLAADAATDEAGFITVWPSGMEGTWTVGCADECTFAEALQADDVTFLKTLIRHLAGEIPVDTSRVFLAGFSQGGQLAQLFACRSELVPAGIAVVSAELYKAVAQDCDPGGAFPVGIVHGDADPIAFYGGFGPEAVVLSVPETVDAWLRHMECGDEPTSEFYPDLVGDFTSATVYRYPGCVPPSAVVLYRVHGGGHNWPGDTGPWPRVTGTRSRNLDATAEFLALFAAASSPPAG